MIIAGFPGIGKTSLARLGEYRIIDLEARTFSIANKKIDNWAYIYVKTANELSKQGYVVFVSTHEEVQNELKKLGESYSVIYPSLEIKEEWIEKLKKRHEENPTNSGNFNAYYYMSNGSAYEKAVKDIEENNQFVYPITSTDYKLEEIVDKILGDYFEARDKKPKVDYENIDNVTILRDGSYTGTMSGYVFNYKGQNYKCPFGIRGLKVNATIRIKNGEAELVCP